MFLPLRNFMEWFCKKPGSFVQCLKQERKLPFKKQQKQTNKKKHPKATRKHYFQLYSIRESKLTLPFPCVWLQAYPNFYTYLLVQKLNDLIHTETMKYLGIEINKSNISTEKGKDQQEIMTVFGSLTSLKCEPHTLSINRINIFLVLVN